MQGNATTSAAHDAAVLNRARSAGSQIHARRKKRSPWMFSLAASFVLGIAVTFMIQQAMVDRGPTAALTIPAEGVVRGTATAGQIPVEQADPAAWYRYIQELLYEGDRQAALEHLKRFNELHPDYVHEP